MKVPATVPSMGQMNLSKIFELDRNTWYNLCETTAKKFFNNERKMYTIP